MSLDPRTPVIVGAGQLTQRTDQGEPAGTARSQGRHVHGFDPCPPAVVTHGCDAPYTRFGAGKTHVASA